MKKFVLTLFISLFVMTPAFAGWSMIITNDKGEERVYLSGLSLRKASELKDKHNDSERAGTASVKNDAFVEK